VQIKKLEKMQVYRFFRTYFCSNFESGDKFFSGEKSIPYKIYNKIVCNGFNQESGRIFLIFSERVFQKRKVNRGNNQFCGLELRRFQALGIFKGNLGLNFDLNFQKNPVLIHIIYNKLII